MRLTQKDKEFLEKLKALMDQRELWIELQRRPVSRFVLRRNYGEQIERRFGVTRQGARWRFQRLMNEIYVSAYETILVVESSFGTSLRKDPMAIAQERAAERRRVLSERGVSWPPRFSPGGPKW